MCDGAGRSEDGIENHRVLENQRGPTQAAHAMWRAVPANPEISYVSNHPLKSRQRKEPTTIKSRTFSLRCPRQKRNADEVSSSRAINMGDRPNMSVGLCMSKDRVERPSIQQCRTSKCSKKRVPNRPGQCSCLAPSKEITRCGKTFSSPSNPCTSKIASFEQADSASSVWLPWALQLGRPAGAAPQRACSSRQRIR